MSDQRQICAFCGQTTHPDRIRTVNLLPACLACAETDDAGRDERQRQTYGKRPPRERRR